MSDKEMIYLDIYKKNQYITYRNEYKEHQVGNNLTNSSTNWWDDRTGPVKSDCWYQILWNIVK